MAETVRNLTIGIIGVGMVGEPIRRWFEEKKGFKRGVNLFCYDTNPKLGYYDDVNKADIIFVSVPTPPNPDGSGNTSIVESAVSLIKGEKIIVIKSTVPQGTTEDLQKKLPQHKFLFNPEFLTESQAWEDFLKPVRQIVGYTEKSRDVAMTVLNILPQAYYQSPGMVSTYEFRGLTATDAEMTKYYSNVIGAVIVGLSNMFKDGCDGLRSLGYNVDYERVRDAIGADPRVGGPAWKDVDHGSYRGFGGYCFPKDLKAHMSKVRDLSTSVLGMRKHLLHRSYEFFAALWNYNSDLLGYQNLTIEDVSRHDKDVILAKRKRIE